MSVAAVVLGEVNTVLQLPPAGMKNLGDWDQLDSDIIAHFIQVQSQIQRSRWNKSRISFTYRGERLLESDFPSFEDFVYAAVYFRQFTAEKDDLLTDAVDRYRRFVDCPIRNSWVHEEQKRFLARLNGRPFMLQEYTVREVFDAFMYGASLMHKAPHIKSKHRARFLQIYDNEPRAQVLYALNTSLKSMMSHVGNVAAVLYRDFGHWLHDHSLPPPDVRWHDRIFDVPNDT